MTTPTAPPARTLALALAILRISLGAFLLVWALEKFAVPQGTVGIWKSFYLISIGPSLPYLIGALEVVLAVAIIVGFLRTWSYGLGLAFHGISVASTWKQLIDPWGLYLFERPQHLFLAGVPVLAAFVTLYLLREWDVWTVDGKRARVAAPAAPPLS